MKSFQTLIHKIIPSISKHHSKLVLKYILECNSTNRCSILQKIDSLLVPYKRNQNPNRQHWICGQIIKYFEQHNMPLFQKIIDIGGGNGNVLDFFAQKYKLNQSDCICIEKEPNDTLATEFQYTYSHTDTIQYLFLKPDNYKETISNLTETDCIICMVALHHMPDNYIRNVILPLIQSKLKPGGFLLLKEHNADSPETQWLIEWEHHLYYLMEQTGQRTHAELQTYLTESVGNYKSRKTYQQLIEDGCNCHCIKTLNNIFETNSLDETPTKLYWQIFKKYIT